MCCGLDGFQGQDRCIVGDKDGRWQALTLGEGVLTLRRVTEKGLSSVVCIYCDVFLQNGRIPIRVVYIFRVVVGGHFGIVRWFFQFLWDKWTGVISVWETCRSLRSIFQSFITPTLIYVFCLPLSLSLHNKQHPLIFIPFNSRFICCSINK